MDALYQNFISGVAQVAKEELNLREMILELDTLYNGSPHWVDQITQEDIDSVPSFAAAGLTKQMISDVIYSAKNADADVVGNLPAFVVLAHIP